MLRGCLLASLIMLAYPIGLVIYFAVSNMALIVILVLSGALVIQGIKARRKS